MEKDTEIYLVTEVGSFGSMETFKDNDPTLSPAERKKKKQQSIDELINEATEINRRNLIK